MTKERPPPRAPGISPVFAFLGAAIVVGLGLGAGWRLAFGDVQDLDVWNSLKIIATALAATIILPALPAAMAVRLIRRRMWRRGRADAIAGALIALILSALVFVFVEGAFADFQTPVRLRAVVGVVCFWLVPNSLAGALAGYMYWRLAGRPG